MGLADYWIFGEMRSDNTTFHYNNTNSGLEQRELMEQFVSQATDEPLSTFWQRLYTGIDRANEVLDHIGTVNMPDANKNQYTGEMKFLRAFHYFTLVRQWGGVPLRITSTQTTDQTKSKGRASVDDIYTQIIADLTDAASKLPKKYTGADVGRPWASRAWAIRGAIRCPKKRLFSACSPMWTDRALEQALLDWLNHVLGTVAPEDDQVSIDGKELLSSDGVEVVPRRKLPPRPQVLVPAPAPHPPAGRRLGRLARDACTHGVETPHPAQVNGDQSVAGSFHVRMGVDQARVDRPAAQIHRVLASEPPQQLVAPPHRGDPVAAERAEMVAEMFAFFDRYYAGATVQTFQRDLDNKNWCLLFYDRTENRLRGFTTLAIQTDRYRGDPLTAVFSGDTIIEKEYRGTFELPQAWIHSVLEICNDLPRPLYWLLISAGYKTYRFLPLFYRCCYPCYAQPTPPETQALLHRMDCDLGALLLEAAKGQVQPSLLQFRQDPSVCIVLAAHGYPGRRAPGSAP